MEEKELESEEEEGWAEISILIDELPKSKEVQEDIIELTNWDND